MNKLFQWVSLLTFGLLLGSCQKDEPIERTNELSEPQKFEMSSSLGAVTVQALSSNTDKVEGEALRAGLYNFGTSEAARTIVKASDFGTNKREARWGVIYDGGKHYAMNCVNAIDQEPSNPSALTQNTVLFKESQTDFTIEGAQLKMYCRAFNSLTDITYGFMCLEGKAGSGDDKTKQYFKDETDPNQRIEGTTGGGSFEKGRHIPIMTEVLDFPAFTQAVSSTSPKFAPRGSLIGLHIKNNTGTNIAVTAIIVEREGALNYRGYFDWSSAGVASFHPEYTAEQLNNTALSFPVYQNETADETGYIINNGSTDDPAFYVWGFQNPNKKGNAFQVQIRYKIQGNDTEQTTKTFNVYAPNSVVDGIDKQFDDGYSYNTIITINSSNKTGGSNGLDWNNGGLLPNTNESLSTSNYVFSHSLDFKTPLDFVAEAPAINQAGTDFVTHYRLPETGNTNTLKDDDAGYYSERDAAALFNGSKSFLANYYPANIYQWRSILPQMEVNPETDRVRFSGEYDGGRTLREYAQVGQMAQKEYQSDYITVREGAKYVTYALRFKGTYWESAWRYSSDQINQVNMLTIKCVPLRDKADIEFRDIRNPDFFERNEATIRSFPAYGFHRFNSPHQDNNTIREKNVWSRWYITGDVGLGIYEANHKAGTSDGNDGWAITVRPFRIPETTISIPPQSNEYWSASLNFKTPLDFVAEAPAINRAGTAFVTNHSIPLVEQTSQLNRTDAGYYTYNEALELFNGTKDFLDGYQLANKNQWQAIIPHNSDVLHFDRTNSAQTIYEHAQVGSMIEAFDYTSDFKTVKEGNLFVTYAIRFKGTDWESAWRYSYEGEANNKYLLIKCVPLKGIGGKTLSGISHPSFFTKHPATVRAFPTYGYGMSSNPTTISQKAIRSFYWTSTETTSPEKSFMLGVVPQSTFFAQLNKITTAPVRPFYKGPDAAKISFGGKSVTLRSKTLLDFVSEAPAINKDGSGFVTSHDLPSTDVLSGMDNSDVGYYNWNAAVQLFRYPRPETLNKYYLPTKLNWNTILPEKRETICFNQEKAATTVVEKMQIRSEAMSQETSEYVTVSEGGSFVTYAIRFKTNSRWVSAWRYSYDGQGSNRYMTIKCVPLIGKTVPELDEIKGNPEYFTTHPCTIRTFPAYGWTEPSATKVMHQYGSGVQIWTATNNLEGAIFRGFDQEGGLIYMDETNKRMPVRPFRR